MDNKQDRVENCQEFRKISGKYQFLCSISLISKYVFHNCLKIHENWGKAPNLK